MIVPVAILATLVSCKKTETTAGSSGTASVDCSSVTSTWAANVQPIVQTYCAGSSSCHASGSHEGPGALTTYQQVYNSRQSIRTAVANGSMPQGTSLTTAQKASVICWIDNGAQDN